MLCFPVYCRLKISNPSFKRFVSNSKSARGCGFNRNKNISLPSTAITAGMVHNIHRISIIGHLYRPDIQIKYVPKAIDSKGSEGTGGPSPPIERSQIAERSNSNLNQVWAKPKKRQTEGSTEHHRNTAAHFIDALLEKFSYKTETITLCV